MVYIQGLIPIYNPNPVTHDMPLRSNAHETETEMF